MNCFSALLWRAVMWARVERTLSADATVTSHTAGVSGTSRRGHRTIQNISARTGCWSSEDTGFALRLTRLKS